MLLVQFTFMHLNSQNFPNYQIVLNTPGLGSTVLNTTDLGSSLKYIWPWFHCIKNSWPRFHCLKYSRPGFHCLKYSWTRFHCLKYSRPRFHCLKYSWTRFHCLKYSWTRFHCIKHRWPTLRCIKHNLPRFHCLCSSVISYPANPLKSYSRSLKWNRQSVSQRMLLSAFRPSPQATQGLPSWLGLTMVSGGQDIHVVVSSSTYCPGGHGTQLEGTERGKIDSQIIIFLSVDTWYLFNTIRPFLRPL